MRLPELYSRFQPSSVICVESVMRGRGRGRSQVSDHSREENCRCGQGTRDSERCSASVLSTSETLHPLRGPLANKRQVCNSDEGSLASSHSSVRADWGPAQPWILDRLANFREKHNECSLQRRNKP
jgi:hypothetical protein